MPKTTIRKLSPQAQYDQRKMAFKLYNKGMRFDEIAALLEMGHVTVRHWVKVAQNEGMSALKPKPRGRKQGEKRTLSEEQSQHIQSVICDKRPDQLKLDFALWTRKAVM